MIKGEPKDWNPYNGWIPIFFQDKDVQESLSQRGVIQSIGELEDICNQKNSDILYIVYPEAARQVIAKAVNFETNFAMAVGQSSVVGIIEAVRNILLDWSLKLEKEGILGDGISFPEGDKQRAKEVAATYNVEKIEHFAGNIGNMYDQSSISINKNFNDDDIKELKELVGQIKSYKEEINIAQDKKEEVERSIENIDNQLLKEKPETTIVQKSLSSIKSIMEGASGNVIAKGIIAVIDKFLL